MKKIEIYENFGVLGDEKDPYILTAVNTIEQRAATESECRCRKINISKSTRLQPGSLLLNLRGVGIIASTRYYREKKSLASLQLTRSRTDTEFILMCASSSGSLPGLSFL